MEAQLIAILIILPFVGAFIYAAIHEYMRYNAEGKATYGLVYDEETGTTHVTGIPEHEDSFDLEEFDPNDWNGFGGQVPADSEAAPEGEDAADVGAETDGTHVTGIAENKEANDSEDFAPDDTSGPRTRRGPRDEDTDKS